MSQIGVLEATFEVLLRGPRGQVAISKPVQKIKMSILSMFDKKI